MCAHPRCDSCRIQTCNLLIRSQMLYSVELRSLPLFASAKLQYYFKLPKFFELSVIESLFLLILYKVDYNSLLGFATRCFLYLFYCFSCI